MNMLIPNPLDNDNQYRRFHHLDIADIDDSELSEELWALRPYLWGLPSNHWLRERVKELGAELAKRQGVVKYEPRRQPRRKLAEGVKL